MWQLTPLGHSGSLRNTALEADCQLAKQGEFTLFSTVHLGLHTTQHFPPWDAPLGAVLGRAFPAPFPSHSRPCLQRARSPLRYENYFMSEAGFDHGNGEDTALECGALQRSANPAARGRPLEHGSGGRLPPRDTGRVHTDQKDFSFSLGCSVRRNFDAQLVPRRQKRRTPTLIDATPSGRPELRCTASQGQRCPASRGEIDATSAVRS
ncbi:hypothetical protein NDU88_001445 [Pleurodeles waltl]|uniref:Uncharacterized protein n=1 Tax=Pleurodeles waltl TaxID=8319 RepID=A0AAV7Q412_PLEWA|nr:hypothetical protein NDU88_001445 [Pleurodeles waltl]